jgi:hypothetical protein
LVVKNSKGWGYAPNAGREPYPHAGRQRDHRSDPSVSATAFSVAASTAPVIRTQTRPRRSRAVLLSDGNGLIVVSRG